MASPDERREALKELFHEARGCVRCPQLAQTRHTVVFGAGNANADLMFVGEAPGRNEDERGLPFVGQAGQLLETLLGEIGLSRDQVFITNVLRCRPPGNRDPHPVEIENCQDYLFRTIDLVQPVVICTLGNFATKLLRNDTTGIMRLHGRAEVRTVGPRAVRLFPVFHPAAALYTPSNVDVLRQDFRALPELLALGAPPQPMALVEPSVEDEPLVEEVEPRGDEAGLDAQVALMAGEGGSSAGGLAAGGERALAGPGDAAASGEDGPAEPAGGEDEPAPGEPHPAQLGLF